MYSKKYSTVKQISALQDDVYLFPITIGQYIIPQISSHPNLDNMKSSN
jgi:hypothetical protein